MAILSRLSPAPGSKHSEKRVGRGTGSKLGKTCGRGTKGQKARNGGNIGKLHFQGGQTPLQRRLPKRGFTNIFRKTYDLVNLRDLEAAFEAGAEVGRDLLQEKGLVNRKGDGIKLLADGEISKAMKITVDRASRAAVEKVKAAGGEVILLAEKEPTENVASGE